MIGVVFTCRERRSLTELCLSRLIELMPQPYQLAIAYNGSNNKYIEKLLKIAPEAEIISNPENKSRFTLINEALDTMKAKYYMHIENDFYWLNQNCLNQAVNYFEKMKEIDYIRFENLPFTEKTFRGYIKLGEEKLGVMKDDAPYRFTFNPHLRREKYPCGRFQDAGFTKQPEQHHNDNYTGTSACLFGDNFRHLGLYDEHGHYKPYYAERFTNIRGQRELENPLIEFDKFCGNSYYRQLFMYYLYENQ